MNDLVICIDLGSAFTKVALRSTPRTLSQLLKLEETSGDLVEFAVPSTVARIRDQGQVNYSCGEAAANLRSGPGIGHCQNWKRDVFAEETLSAPPAGWEALLASTELRQLAQQYGISVTEVEQLRQLLDQARLFLNAPTLQQARQTASRTTRDAIRDVACAFFKWLRSSTLEVIRELHPTIREPENIPVRVTVPAFSAEMHLDAHAGCQFLAEAIRGSDWKLHPSRGFISEPLANLVGVLTGGVNCIAFKHLSRGRRAEQETLQLGEMFGRGPFMAALRSGSCYRAFVIDIGAFTTDFALLRLDPQRDIVSEPERYISPRLDSLTLGVSDLDNRVRQVFTQDQRRALERLNSIEWNDIRRRVYAPLGTYRLEDTTLGAGEQRAAIDTVLAEFANEVQEHALTFFGQPEPKQLTDLILTGGGMSIPLVRDTFQRQLRNAGHVFHNVYLPTGRQDLNRSRRGNNPRMIGLNDQLARGGTALGGASIFFERCFY